MLIKVSKYQYHNPFVSRVFKKRLQVQAHGIMETAAKKNKIVKPGDHIIVPLPDMDWAKIDAHSLHAVIVEENNNGEFKLGQGTF